MKKWLITPASLIVALFMFLGSASAHVTVSPNEVPQGSYQVFTVRVPSETKGTSTVSIKVAVPEGVSVSRSEPKPGWKATREKREDGTAASITWTAEDGKGLAETEFTEFRMQGKVADDAKELVWKTYQTYADGSVAEWVGAEGSDKPAAVTTVTLAVAGNGDGHGAAAGGNSTSTADNHGAAAADQAAAAGGTNDAGSISLWLSIAAVVLGLAALAVALSGRRKRG